MNQILMTENKKKKQRSGESIEIKGIVRFFAIVIMIFGIVLAGQGSYAIYKEADDKKPSKMPHVTIGRLNDSAILYVEHTVEISKITYSWDNGEKTVLPEGSLIAQEEILLPNQNSTLYITIEDMNGKKVNYQKQYTLEGVDTAKPTIQIDTADGSSKMTITAIDETEIAYLSYQWEDEEKVVVEATTLGQTQIVQEIKLTPGTRRIHIIAEDKNGNVEQIDKQIEAKNEPKMRLLQEGKKIYVEASDEDGVKEIRVIINGKQSSIGNLSLKYVKVGPVQLQEGNNTISVEVTNINGVTNKASTELQYTP